MVRFIRWKNCKKYISISVHITTLFTDWFPELQGRREIELTSVSNHLERITAVAGATTLRTMVMMGRLSVVMSHHCSAYVIGMHTCISHLLSVPVLLILRCRRLGRHGCTRRPARLDRRARRRRGGARSCQCWCERSAGFRLEVFVSIHKGFRSIHGWWEVADKLLLILQMAEVTS